MSRLLVNERRQNHMAMHDPHQCNALRISQVQERANARLLPPSSVFLPYGEKLMEQICLICGEPMKPPWYLRFIPQPWYRYLLFSRFGITYYCPDCDMTCQVRFERGNPDDN